MCGTNSAFSLSAFSFVCFSKYFSLWVLFSSRFWPALTPYPGHLAFGYLAVCWLCGCVCVGPTQLLHFCLFLCLLQQNTLYLHLVTSRQASKATQQHCSSSYRWLAFIDYAYSQWSIPHCVLLNEFLYLHLVTSKQSSNNSATLLFLRWLAFKDDTGCFLNVAPNCYLM